MLRAILKLVAVGGVIALAGTADSIELYAASGGALVVMPFAVAALTERRKAIAEPPKRTTIDVIPLPAPAPLVPTADDDPEGLTVRAPMSHEEAFEMHARYAPSFDQQAAIARYEAQYAAGEEPLAQDPEAFDQGRYAAALQYADAFEAQLARGRRTAAYDVAPNPRRTARGSVAPQTYRAIDMRSDQRRSFAMSPNDWEDKTLVGVHPLKRFK